MENPYSERPWLKFYDKHVPPNMEYPDTTYTRLFEETIRKLPDKTAVNYLGTEISFRELDMLSNRFAGFLRQKGIEPGQVVGVNLPNIPAYYVAVLGIQKAGCVLSGVSPLLTPKELKYQLNDSGARVLIALDALTGKVEEAVPGTGVAHVVVTGIADFLPLIKGFLGKLLKKIPTRQIQPIPGVEITGFLDICRNYPPEPVRVEISPGSPCLMQYTGGTTGPAKGAVLTHRNMVSHIIQFSRWIDIQDGMGTVASAFPLFHQAGLFVSMFSFVGGATQIAIPNPRDMGFIIQMLKKYRPGYIVNVPTVFIELIKQPAFRNLDFSQLEWCASGAAPFPPEYIKEFESIIGEGKLIEVFGMTETSPITTSLPRYGTKKPGSVGIPLPDTEVKLIDPDSGAIVPVGEPGEFVVKGPQIFTIGYHNKADETAKVLKDGWMYTGDVCRMDEDGYFYVVDRLKDMVNVSGFKVFTRQVDDVLIEHPDIDMAATVGLPDPARPGSEIVTTAVVLKPGREKNEAMRESLTNFMKERVAPYKVPRRIEFMDQLPVSAVGKVLKRELRKMLEK